MERSPARLFAVVAGISGTLLVLLSPPFRWGDENVHFRNGFRLSEGEFWNDPAARRARSTVPRGVHGLILAFSLKSRRSPDRTIPLRETVAMRAITLKPDERVFLPTPRSPYTPLPYAPQALGIAAARLFTDSTLLLFLAARAANLSAWMALVWLALRTAPGLRWTLCVLALAPMSLFLATTCSVDAITNGLAFLWTASVARAATVDRVLDRWDFAKLAVLATLLALTKFVYGWLVLLVFLIPARLAGGPRRLLAAGGVLLAIGAGAVAAWLALADPTSSFEVDAKIRRAQRMHVRWLIEEPGRVAGVVVRTVAHGAGRWARQLVDTHWDKRADRRWMLALWCAALAIALAFDSPLPGGISIAGRLIALFAAGAAVLSFVLVAYLLWTPLFAPAARGVQGRYLIPILPAVAIALAPPRPIRGPRLRRAGRALAAALGSVPLAATLLEAVDLSIR
jgi:hypothetical protein